MCDVERWLKKCKSEIAAASGLALVILFILYKPETLSSITSLWGAVLIFGIILSLVGVMSSNHKCELMIFIIVAISASLCCKIYCSEDQVEMNGHYLLVAIVGIAALIIPLILSISSNHNIGSQLDSGEIRKSIVISLTIIYIIFLVMSFEQTLNDQPSATNGTYLLNVTYDENTTDLAHKKIIINITSVSEGVLQVIPVTATANVANGTVQIIPHVTNKTGAADGSSGAIPLTSDNGTSLPTDAISSFTKNFLWVYALIISFYFGSRILEDRGDKSKFSEYISEVMKTEKRLLDPLDIAKARFSLGEIGPREYKKLKDCLGENLKVKIEEAYLKKHEKNGIKINKAQNQDVFKNGLIILHIRNDTFADIDVEKILINNKEKDNIDIISNKRINHRCKGILIAKHNFENKDEIKSVEIKTIPTDESPADEKYSDIIMNKQIKDA